MQFEASYEKRSSRSRASSRSPLRSSLKRSASFSASRPHAVPLGGYVAPAPAPPPAPAPWVQGATRITYPAHAYPSASSYNHAAFATHNPTTTSISRYQVPGAYPDPIPAGGPASSYTYNTTKTTETKYEYNKPPTTTTATTMYTYRPPSPPLEKPEVKAAIAHEQNLRMLTEQSHQETIKRQILEMEIAKAAVQRDKVRQEEEARQRMQRLYMISQQQQQQQMVMHQAARVAEEAHHRYHHHHGRSRSTHSIHRSRSRSRARSRSRSRELEYDEHRRSLHVCGKCHHRGHYSKECHHHGHHSSLLLHDGPRSSAPALLGPPSRGRRSRRGSVCSEEEYAVFDSEEEEGWWSDEYSERQIGRAVPADSGVLVMYAPGGGPASRRSSFRHVVGA